MAKIPRPADELAALLDEQLGFIERSAASYDEGFAGEAKRLALAIRVLVHDTVRSRSLLSQAGMKQNLSLLDTCIPFDPHNVLGHSGLTAARIGRGPAEVLPLLDEFPMVHRKVTFQDWWEGVVFVDSSRALFSRQDIVLTVANQDGGGHVDPQLDACYANLTRHNSLDWWDEIGGRVTPTANPVPAALRQIGHEVLKSLREGYVSPTHTIPEGTVLAFAPMIHHAELPPPLPTVNLVKRPRVPNAARNGPCPCGSGRKFKKCCGAN